MSLEACIIHTESFACSILKNNLDYCAHDILFSLWNGRRVWNAHPSDLTWSLIVDESAVEHITFRPVNSDSCLFRLSVISSR